MDQSTWSVSLIHRFAIGWLLDGSDAGHWVSVSVGRELGIGIGNKVTAYEAGAIGDVHRLIASGEIIASSGYERIAKIDVVTSAPREDSTLLHGFAVARNVQVSVAT